MNTKEIIREALIQHIARSPTTKAALIEHALQAAGYRIVGPGELDEATKEKCAEVADEAARRDEIKGDRRDAKTQGDVAVLTGYIMAAVSSRYIAKAIRSLTATQVSQSGTDDTKESVLYQRGDEG